MREQKKEESIRISPQPGEDNEKGSTDLSEEELKKVSGGLTVRKAGKGQQEF